MWYEKLFNELSREEFMVKLSCKFRIKLSCKFRIKSQYEMEWNQYEMQ